jgi:PKD repeat protein
MKKVFIALFVAFATISQAQVCNYLAYDGFDYAAETPLEGLQGGTGWQAPWNVQSENTTVPGFQIASNNAMTWLDLQTIGGHVSGGFAYLTAGRRLKTEGSGPFAEWLNNDGAIGKPGTTIWASILLRKTQNNNEPVHATLHESNLQWCSDCTNNKVSIGYFGDGSNVNNQRLWGLRIGGAISVSNVVMVPNETVFLVLKIDFLAQQTQFSLFINPASLGNDTPAPTPNLVQSSTTPFGLRSLALYLGDDAASGHADEFRVGSTYACVAPDADINVNQPPNAQFSMTPNSGTAPQVVQFDGSASSDAGGSIASYHWDFGDGTPDATGAVVQHTYTATGIFNVILTVSDAQGLQHSITQKITIFKPDGSFSCLLGLNNDRLASCTGNDGRFSVTNYDNIPLKLTNAAGAQIGAAAGNSNQFDQLAPGQYVLTAAGANGCRDTFWVHIQRDSNTCPGWSPDPCAMKIGVGIEGLAYYSTGRPFKDFFKSCGTWITYDPNPPGGNFVWNTENQSHIPADADGYPTVVPFDVPNGSGKNNVRGIISAIGFVPVGVPMRLLYDGVGTLQMQGNLTVSSNQPGQIDFVVNNEDNIFFNLTASQAGNPVRNIRVVEVANIDTYQAQPFRQSFLDKCMEFNTLRLMDWGHTNGSGQVQWANRTRSAYYSQAEAPNGGMAYEYMVQLANETNKNIWVCIPHQADDDYIANMAALFRDGLEPGIQVYIEYSNETWNWLFAQAHWVADNGPQNISYPRRYAERATHAFDIWRTVWGNQTSRLHRVLGTQSGYDWVTEEIMAHADPEKYDYISPSWYVGLDHGSTGQPNLQSLGAAATPQDVLENASNVFLDFYPRWEMVYRLAKLYNKKVVNYEGGQHFTDFTEPPYLQAMYDAQVLPGMYELYDRMLDSLRRLGSELPMAFVMTGPWQSKFGSWGHIFNEDDPAPWTDRPKFQVLLDQIAQCPEPPSSVQNSVQIPASLRIAPNPTTGQFALDVPDTWLGQGYQVRISDVLGQWQAGFPLDEKVIQLPTKVRSGIYWVVISDRGGKGLKMGKLVVLGGE